MFLKVSRPLMSEFGTISVHFKSNLASPVPLHYRGPRLVPIQVRIVGRPVMDTHVDWREGHQGTCSIQEGEKREIERIAEDTSV